MLLPTSAPRPRRSPRVPPIGRVPCHRPERIRPIAERFGLDADAVLDNIVYARAHTYEQQFGEKEGGRADGGRAGGRQHRVLLPCIWSPTC